MKKKFGCTHVLLLVTIFFTIFTEVCHAQAQSSVEYEFAFAVHSISGNQYIRHVGPDATADTLGNDEYYAIYMTIHNNSEQPLRFSKAALMVDKSSYSYNGTTIRNGDAYSLYLDYDVTKDIVSGKHTLILKLDGKQVYSTTFTMPRNWGSVFNLPTTNQINKAGRYRSPYISFYTNFGNNVGYTEYAIDLRMDYQPVDTFICPINWWMNLSSLEKKYSKVWSDYGSTGCGYCGFQVWGDGTTGVIMTLWDVFYQEKDGRIKQVKAKVLYPESAKDTDFNKSSEGSFVHYLYPYRWKAGKEYRLLLQQSVGDNGNTLLTLWLKDIAQDQWTELYCFDTGLQDVWISSTAGFVENPNPGKSAYPRTIEFWNIRARMKSSGKWENAKTVTFGVNGGVTEMNYEGSYNFGQDAGSCWIITSGIPGLCKPNKKTGPYKIPFTEKGQPY